MAGEQDPKAAASAPVADPAPAPVANPNPPAPSSSPADPAAAPAQPAAAEVKAEAAASSDKPAAVADKPAEGADKPKAEPVKAEEVKPASETPTLLEEAGKKPDAKPADKPAEAKPGDKPAEAKSAEAAKPAPVQYQAFQFPEGVKIADQKAFDEATGILAQHQISQEVAQDLVNRHVKAMQDYAAHVASEQQRVFAETRKGWRNEVMADDLIGGSGHQTAMGVVARMRDLFVPEAERKAFNDFLRLTGAGDHPLFNKLLYRIGMKFDEAPQAPMPHNPPPDRGKAPGGRRAALYDHATSVARRNGAN